MPGGTNYRPTAFRSAFPQPYLPSHPSGLPCRLAVLLRLPPLPGGHRGGVSPQPAAMPASVVLETAELVAAVELDVPPCQPGPNLFGVEQLAADRHPTDHAPAAVAVNLLHRKGLAGDQIAEGLLLDVAERLFGLRGVDAVEPDLKTWRFSESSPVKVSPSESQIIRRSTAPALPARARSRATARKRLIGGSSAPNVLHSYSRRSRRI